MNMIPHFWLFVKRQFWFSRRRAPRRRLVLRRTRPLFGSRGLLPLPAWSTCAGTASPGGRPLVGYLTSLGAPDRRWGGEQQSGSDPHCRSLPRLSHRVTPARNPPTAKRWAPPSPWPATAPARPARRKLPPWLDRSRCWPPSTGPSRLPSHPPPSGPAPSPPAGRPRRARHPALRR